MILSSYDLEKINSLPWNIVLWWETKIKSKEKHYSLNFYWSSALPLHPHREPCRQTGNGVCDYSVTAPLCSSLFLRLSFWSDVGSPWALSSSRPIHQLWHRGLNRLQSALSQFTYCKSKNLLQHGLVKKLQRDFLLWYLEYLLTSFLYFKKLLLFF